MLTPLYTEPPPERLYSAKFHERVGSWDFRASVAHLPIAIALPVLQSSSLAVEDEFEDEHDF
jgi:hypothetical protein